MKIIMVTSLAYPHIGGIPSHVWEISRKLTEKGFDIEIYSTDPSGRLERSTEIDGVKIERYRSFAPNRIYFFSRELYTSLKVAQADIIHSHGYRAFPMLAAALAKTYNKTPFVVTLHLGFSKVGRIPYLVYNPIFGRTIFRRADKVIIVSPIEAKMISELEKWKNKITLIPNGVDINKICSYKNKLREFDHSTIKVMFVGRLEKRKGIHFLIRAFKKATEKCENISLTIVGEGPFKTSIKNLIRELKLKDKICLQERLSQDKLYKTYSQSHIFVLPSEFEAHSIALTESMAFGLVPIATNAGGNKFLVKNNRDGFLIGHPPNIDKLSGILLRLVNNRKLMSTMSERATKKSQLFNINRVTKDLETVYQSICE